MDVVGTGRARDMSPMPALADDRLEVLDVDHLPAREDHPGGISGSVSRVPSGVRRNRGRECRIRRDRDRRFRADRREDVFRRCRR